MALTATQKTQMYQFFTLACGAAPGVTYMNQLDAALNSGMTVDLQLKKSSPIFSPPSRTMNGLPTRLFKLTSVPTPVLLLKIRRSVTSLQH